MAYLQDINDRLVLGLKGTMSEAELHILRARLEGGIRHKAARGALRRGLPVGFLWGDEDGEVRFHPDEAVTGAIRAVFTHFAEVGSVRQVWLWFRAEGLSFPLHTHGVDGIRWVAPTYTAIHHVLTNPVFRLTPPLPAEASAMSRPHQMASHLLLHPGPDVGKAPTRVPDPEVVYPAAQDRIDHGDHPPHRLRVGASEHLLELPQ
jgi:hypothetical protein